MQNHLNPALRLHVLLTSVLDGNPNEQMLEIWAKLFDISEPSEPKVARCLIAMADCLDETRRLLGTRDGLNLALFTTDFPSIELAIAPSRVINTRSQVLTPYLTTTVLTRLEFCSHELQKFYIEDAISTEDLTAIRDAADEIFEQIFNSSIESELKRVLLEDAEKLRASITLYKIKGVKGLQEAHRTFIGAIATQSEAVLATKGNDKSVLEKLAKLMKRVDDLTSGAVRVYKLVSGPVQVLLTMLGYDTPSISQEVPSNDGNNHLEA